MFAVNFVWHAKQAVDAAQLIGTPYGNHFRRAAPEWRKMSLNFRPLLLLRICRLRKRMRISCNLEPMKMQPKTKLKFQTKPLSFKLLQSLNWVAPHLPIFYNWMVCKMTRLLASLRRHLRQVLPGLVLQCCGLEAPQVAENHFPLSMTASGPVSSAPPTPPTTCGRTTATTSLPSSRGSTRSPSSRSTSLSGLSASSSAPLLPLSPSPAILSPMNSSPSWMSPNPLNQSDSGSDASDFSYQLLFDESTSDSSGIESDISPVIGQWEFIVCLFNFYVKMMGKTYFYICENFYDMNIFREIVYFRIWPVTKFMWQFRIFSKFWRKITIWQI